jgi:hypothetical protein
MIFRQIREQVGHHNWFAVAVELAIVVVGVFLGMQVTNWSQARTERQTASEYRQEIIGDLKNNEADVIARAIYYRQARAHAIAALRALQHPGASSGEAFLVDAYQASQGWVRPFERAAYDEMVGGGGTRRIGGPALRSELSSYYVSARGFEQTIRGTVAYRERIRRLLDFDVQDRIRARCDDIMVDLPGGGQAARLPETCSLGLDPATIARAVAKVRSAPELDEDLSRQVGDIDQKLQLLDRTLVVERRLRGHLAARQR